MDLEKFNQDLRQIVEEVRSYLKLKIELYTLVGIERFSKVFSKLIVLIIFAMFSMFFILLLTFAFVYWYASVFESIAQGFLIAAAFFALLAILAFILSKRLFLNPMIRALSEAAFEKEDLPEKPEIPDEDEEDQ